MKPPSSASSAQFLVLMGFGVKCSSCCQNCRNESLSCVCTEYEVNLIRLLDKLTNGTLIEVNETGTSLYYQPGLLSGGTIEHECCKLRGLGYYLEVLMGLGPFCKKPLSIVLRGVTNNEVSVRFNQRYAPFMGILIAY